MLDANTAAPSTAHSPRRVLEKDDEAAAAEGPPATCAAAVVARSAGAASAASGIKPSRTNLENESAHLPARVDDVDGHDVDEPTD
jgi:hypothetical protein